MAGTAAGTGAARISAASASRASREPNSTPAELGRDEAGGLSGAPLFERSTAMLRAARERLGEGPTLIGVGGVFGVREARAKREAGADLVQAYTGLVYRGSAVARECATI